MMEFNGLFFDACRDGASLVGEAADSYVCCRSRDEDGAAGLNCGGAALAHKLKNHPIINGKIRLLLDQIVRQIDNK